MVPGTSQGSLQPRLNHTIYIYCKVSWQSNSDHFANRQFPEITGKDNLTVFSYSGRVKSPEWRWQQRRANLRHVEIFSHGPIITYTRLPAGGTYYPICMFSMNSERLIGISDAFSAFVYGYPLSCPRAHCTPNKSVPALRYTHRPGPIYTGHSCRHLPSAVPRISEDHLFLPCSNFYLPCPFFSRPFTNFFKYRKLHWPKTNSFLCGPAE